VGSTLLQQPKSSTKRSFNSRSWKELEHLVLRKNESSSMLLQNDAPMTYPQFSAPLPSSLIPKTNISNSHHYKPGLAPLPSPLRSHCLA
jgi:hypothetical protein